jgi:hypothetical protein
MNCATWVTRCPRPCAQENDEPSSSNTRIASSVGTAGSPVGASSSRRAETIGLGLTFALRKVLTSSPLLTAMVLVLLVLSGLGWTFGPRQLRLVFLVLGFLVLFIGATATIVIPRRLAAARLAGDRQALRPPDGAHSGLMRRRWWWSLTWTIASPLNPVEVSSRVQAFVEARKSDAEWPFGDTTSKLYVESDGFSTAPGWLWRSPYKPLLSGWVLPDMEGASYTVKLATAYDAPFEVLFVIVGVAIGIGSVVAFFQQASFAGWQYLPFAFGPLALILVIGQIGRWRLKRVGERFVEEVARAINATDVFIRAGWR